MKEPSQSPLAFLHNPLQPTQSKRLAVSVTRYRLVQSNKQAVIDRSKPITEASLGPTKARIDDITISHKIFSHLFRQSQPLM